MLSITKHMEIHASYWDYLSPHQRDLIREGSYIYQEIFADGRYNFQDYSFIVFPFAKAFEGFIKQFLLDMHLISERQYNSDHIRVGRLLSPEAHYAHNDSIYERLTHLVGKEAADMIWMTWKYCRNQVFHYYPHNSKSLSLNEAKERIHLVLSTITTCYDVLKYIRHKNNSEMASRDMLNTQ